MKLRELLESTPKRTCEYLNSIGIEFEKVTTTNGTKFDLIKSSPKETKNIVDDILLVPEITNLFDIGYGGGTTIVVTFK